MPSQGSGGFGRLPASHALPQPFVLRVSRRLTHVNISKLGGATVGSSGGMTTCWHRAPRRVVVSVVASTVVVCIEGQPGNCAAASIGATFRFGEIGCAVRPAPAPHPSPRDHHQALLSSLRRMRRRLNLKEQDVGRATHLARWADNRTRCQSRVSGLAAVVDNVPIELQICKSRPLLAAPAACRRFAGC